MILGSHLRTHLAFASILIAIWAMVLESVAVSVALPSISIDFEVSAATGTWILAMPQFIIVALLLPMASLGESIGYRRLCLLSLLIFSVSTVICVVAPSFTTLVLARAVQAIGSAGMMAMSFAIARTIYDDKYLGTAIGVMAASVAIASSGGPAVSGFLLEYFGWREVFVLLLTCSTIGYIGGSIFLPPNRPSDRRFDFTSSVLVAASLSCVLFVINGAANFWPVWWLVLAGLLSLVGFVVLTKLSLGKKGAVFPLDLLTLPVFNLSVIASMCSFSAQSLGFVLLPFHLVWNVGLSPIDMALIVSVWPISTALIAPLLGWLSNRIPPGPIGVFGLVVFALGFFLLAALPQDASSLQYAMCLAICGLGFSAFQTPNNRLVMLSAPKERSGAASGMISLARQFGRSIGTAISAFTLAATSQIGVLEALNIAGGLALVGAIAAFVRALAISGKEIKT